MPISSFRMAQLIVASGLLVLATFTSAKAQETPLDPNAADIPLPAAQPAGLEPVTQLANPEINYEHCAPAPGAWNPPVFYPDHTLYCPTGVVHRDWLREKTLGFFVGRRQRMLEKDYQWSAQNGHQPVCCPPHSNWGHPCDACPGEGCPIHGKCLGGACETHCAPCNAAPASPTNGDHTSALNILPAESVLSEPELGNFSGIALSAHFAEESSAGEILLVSDQRPASSGAGIETAGFHHVSDSCTNGYCNSYGNRYGNGNGYGNGRGRHCPLHHGSNGWEECPEDDDDCDCPICCLKRRCLLPFCCLCDALYSDRVGGGGRWHREIPTRGSYHIAYPVNPYHFDQRDGRIYAAQGYGHAVGVPLAPNVQHTYNYGWGLPSSRLTPVSRMPGAPGVANPAGVAGPGIYPPGFPAPLTGGFPILPQ